MTEEGTAYHEAGHAVAAVALELGLLEVTTRNMPDALGWAQIKPLDFEPGNEITNEQMELLARRAVFKFAGPEAERRFFGPPYQGDDWLDFRSATEVIDFIATDTELGPYRLTLERAAKELVEATWPSIQKLAGELLRRTTIDGSEATEIIREALPPDRLPLAVPLPAAGNNRGPGNKRR